MSNEDPGVTIDPWGGASAYGGPTGPYGGMSGTSAIRPLNKVLPYIALAFGAAYVLASLAQIYALNSRASLAGKVVNGDQSVTADQVNSADHLVSAISVVCTVVFIGTIITIIVWQRSLRSTLAPLGVYGQVLKRSGYPIFRAAWLASILLSFLLNGTGAPVSAQGVVDHDHEYMLYYVLRAAVGVVLVVLAVRLRRISEESVAQLVASQYAQGVGFAGSGS